MHALRHLLLLSLVLLVVGSTACSDEPETAEAPTKSQLSPEPKNPPAQNPTPTATTAAETPTEAPTTQTPQPADVQPTTSTTEVTVKSDEPEAERGSFGSLFNRAIGGWEVFFFIILFGFTVFIAVAFLRSFGRFVERVRKGRGAWRTFVLSIAPVVRIGVLLALLLVFGFILFEGSAALLVILLAVAAISVGLGLVELVRNILAGALIGLQKPFAVGDLVRIGDLAGKVQHIGLRSTLLIGADGRRIDVPNSHFQTDVVVNTSISDIGTPVEMRVALPTDTDIRAAKAFAFKAAYISQYASPRRSPEVLVEQESERELALIITAYTFAPEFTGRLKSEVTELIFEGLKDHKTNKAFLHSI